jgi:fatty acid desaturase
MPTPMTLPARPAGVPAAAEAGTKVPCADLAGRERVRRITTAIHDAERRLRARWGILRHQDALGVGFFLLAAAAFVASGLLFLAGVLPAGASIAIGALAASVLRELEHDLAHNLYFRRRKSVQNLLMGAVWPFLGNLPHPWFRREMHLLHHQTSGQVEDFEERLIGNGMPFGWKKFLAMVEPGLAMLVRRKEFAEIPFYDAKKFFRALVPVAVLHLVVWYGFLLGNLAVGASALLGASLPTGLLAVLGVVNAAAVAWAIPNVVRQVAVQILSSTMHYYGDVDERTRETQVLDAWYWLPFNLFACNFGSTHTIHHFVVGQPFYLRQMVAGAARRALRECGIRFNDLGTLERGNRYERADPAKV